MLILSLQLHLVRHILANSSSHNFYHLLYFELQDSCFLVECFLSLRRQVTWFQCACRYVGRRTEKCTWKRFPWFTATYYCTFKHLRAAVNKGLCFGLCSLRLNLYGHNPCLNPLLGASYGSIEQIQLLSVWMTSKYLGHW